MLVLVYRRKKRWLFTVTKGLQILSIDDEEVQVQIDKPKEIVIDDMYIIIMEEVNGFGVFRKYEITEQVIFSRYDYASILIKCLKRDILMNLKEGRISENNQLFVNNRVRSLVNEGDLLTLFNVKILVTKRFLLINNPDDVKINLKIQHNFSFPWYTISKDTIACNEYFKRKEMPVFAISFRQFDKIHPFEKPSSFVMILPMLMMASASLVVGLNACYNAYQQGKSGFDLVVPLLLPSTMILSTILVKPLHNRIEKHKHGKKVLVREHMIHSYFEDLCDKFSKVENQFDEFQHESLLVGSQVDKHSLNTSGLFNKFDCSNVMITLGFGQLCIPSQFKQIPDQTDLNYYEKFLEFNKKICEPKNRILAIDFKHIHSILIQDDLVFEWIVMQLIYLINHKQTIIYLFTTDEWLIGRKEYLFMNIHVVTVNSIEFKEQIGQSIGFIVDGDVYTQSNIKCDVVIFYQQALSSCGVTVTRKDDVLLLDEQQCITPCANWSQINEFKNWYSRTCGSKPNRRKSIKLFDLYNYPVNSNAIDKNWNRHTSSYGLMAPIGVCNQETLNLDLKETGHGPHLLIGATTGGGKSEAILTILYSFMIKYHPDYFQFALIDFKGGGLADAFQCNDVYVPHCVGCLTNLDETEMERLMVSFNNESRRRQVLFTKMVRLSNQSPMNIDLYQSLVEQGMQLPQLAHLLYVIDEFAELKDAEPNFIHELVRLARTGRSLGIHLLLSTQKPAAVVDAQIWANCSTRICLKVQDKQDSLEMIGCDKGVYLKKPGQFYLLHNQEVSEGMFALTSAPYTYHKKTNTTVLYNNFDYAIKDIEQGELQINTILNYVTKLQFDINSLWQKSLTTCDDALFYTKKSQLGIIDDINHNKQYPYLFNSKENMLIYCMDKNEKKVLVDNILELLIQEFNDDLEIIVIDFENLVEDIETTYKFMQAIRNKNGITSLVTSLLKQDVGHRRIVVVTHFPALLDALNENYQIIEQLLYEKTHRGCNFIFFTNTANSMKYSLLGYFPIRIGLLIQEPNDFALIFEKTIKKCMCKSGFGYVKDGDVMLFRYIPLRFSHEKNVHCTIIPTRWLDNEVVCRCSEHIVLGIDVDTIEEIRFPSQKLMFVLSKYPHVYQRYITHVFSKSSVDIHPTFLDLEKLTDADMLRIVSENTACSFIIGSHLSRFSNSDVRKLYTGENIIWVGEGFQEQTIINNDQWVKLASNEAFFVTPNKGIKMRCIDKYE